MEEYQWVSGWGYLMTKICKFTQCCRCDKYWHMCNEEIDEPDFENYSDHNIQVYCQYCGHCQICGCCNCLKKDCWICNEKLIVRFEKFFVRLDPNLCWNWLGSKAARYGRFSIGNKQLLAHRASYSCYNGEIPANRLVLHSCDNVYCVNPDHLFLGNHSDNAKDMVIKQRHCKKGQFKTGHKGFKGNAKLIEKDLSLIRKLLKEGNSHSFIASLFKVSRTTITEINRGRTWK